MPYDNNKTLKVLEREYEHLKRAEDKLRPEHADAADALKRARRELATFHSPTGRFEEAD
ncbi:MAG: hypothetical protein ACRD8U_21285 [Pyrinomonadaceae bacterium]